jgi:NAD(P)-dependent dehydrogenase (short-subunit alcohol dehydrogenase family)
VNGRFTHRTALVTGSSDGIGAAIAQRLAAEGAQVVVTGRDADRGLAVVDLIAREGGHADFIAVDLLGGADAVRRLADQAISLLGQVDILVNNAALLIAPAPTEQVTEDLIDRAL